MLKAHIEFASGDMLRTADLDRVKHLIKIKKLAAIADLNPASIVKKVGKGTELSIFESEALMGALNAAGVIVKHQPTTD